MNGQRPDASDGVDTSITMASDTNIISEINLPVRKATFWRKLRKKIVAGLKRNLVPGIILNCVGLLIVVLFYTTQSVNDSLSQLGDVKAGYGFLYSFLATAAFGGILPFLITIIMHRDKRHWKWLITRFVYYFLFWGYRGVEVDALYRLQALMFGSDASPSTVACKVSFDMLVYSFLWAAWSCNAFTRWEQLDFNFARLWRECLTAREWWIDSVLVVLFSNWMVWTPATSLIYALPSALQVPLFNIVLVFWVLLLLFLSASVDSQDNAPAGGGGGGGMRRRGQDHDDLLPFHEGLENTVDLDDLGYVHGVGGADAATAPAGKFSTAASAAASPAKSGPRFDVNASLDGVNGYEGHWRIKSDNAHSLPGGSYPIGSSDTSSSHAGTSHRSPHRGIAATETNHDSEHMRFMRSDENEDFGTGGHSDGAYGEGRTQKDASVEIGEDAAYDD